MGQKINPNSLRTGIVKNWQARWFFSGKGNATPPTRYPYAKFLEEDEAIRDAIRKKIVLAGIAGIEIERTSNAVRVIIRAARPGLVIGQGGKGIEELTKGIEARIQKLRARGGKKTVKRDFTLSVNVEELKRSEISAPYVAQQIAWDLEKRLRFRRTIKKHLDAIMQHKEVRGAKILVGGRLDGKEIARREWLRAGSLPLQTLRSDVDYGQATAYTTYGTIGIKVWIYRGEIFEKDKKENRNK